MTGPPGIEDHDQQLDETELRARQRRMLEQGPVIEAPVVIAVGLRTPENLGAVMRQADAAGSRRLVLVDTRCVVNSAKVSRIARSADRSLQVDTMTLEAFLNTLPEFPPLVALEITRRSRDLYRTELPLRCSLVSGGERTGIPAPILERCETAVHIPMYGINTSMNVSHALTLALYEWRRQHAV